MKIKNTKLTIKDLYTNRVVYMAEPNRPVVKARVSSSPRLKGREVSLIFGNGIGPVDMRPFGIYEIPESASDDNYGLTDGTSDRITYRYTYYEFTLIGDDIKYLMDESTIHASECCMKLFSKRKHAEVWAGYPESYRDGLDSILDTVGTKVDTDDTTDIVEEVASVETVPSTPPSRWYAAGEDDLHGDTYIGDMISPHIATDSLCKRLPDIADSLTGMTISMAAKDRLRWLSRRVHLLSTDEDALNVARAKLPMGELTDDELVFKFHVYEEKDALEAAADRMHWLQGELNELTGK